MNSNTTKPSPGSVLPRDSASGPWAATRGTTGSWPASDRRTAAAIATDLAIDLGNKLPANPEPSAKRKLKPKTRRWLTASGVVVGFSLVLSFLRRRG